MSHNIIIIGAGGHSKVVADIIIKTGNNLLGFLDDNLEIGTNIIRFENEKFNVIGKISDSIKYLKEDKNLKFIIAIGNNYVREKISEEYKLPYITLIHPSANVSINTIIQEGTVVMANACINANAIIGKHCIINTGAIIEHDNFLENFIHISPNATLCGTVKIGECTHIGASATIKNNTNITKNCIIGAGAVVVKNIDKTGTYIGVPAKKM